MVQGFDVGRGEPAAVGECRDVLHGLGLGRHRGRGPSIWIVASGPVVETETVSMPIPAYLQSRAGVLTSPLVFCAPSDSSSARLATRRIAAAPGAAASRQPTASAATTASRPNQAGCGELVWDHSQSSGREPVKWTRRLARRR